MYKPKFAHILAAVSFVSYRPQGKRAVFLMTGYKQSLKKEFAQAALLMRPQG